MRITGWRVLGAMAALLAVSAVTSASCGGSESRPGVLSSTSSGGTAGTGGGGGTAGGGGTGGGGGTAGGGGIAGAGGVGGGGGAGGAGGYAESCTNQQQDGNETDVDCGGSCPPCDNLLQCEKGSDCISQSCVSGHCAPPTCVDGVKNGDETDTDCGGPNCGPCDDYQACTDPAHCKSGVCNNNICQPPACNDGVQNGDESDTDCGGSCPGKCLYGQSCVTETDCVGDACTTGVCACPADMAIVPSPGAGGYCIDSYEVDYNQYQAFYIANPPVNGQVAECLWNLDYTPDLNWPAADVTQPVVGVNWCEARAFCAWAGKRLCGKIGGGGNAYGDYASTTKSEWFNACSAQGNNLYPYGSTYDPLKCNGVDANIGGTITATSQAPACLGGTLDLWHMSGNVREWENSCDGTTGAGDNCRVRGGSYLSNAAGLLCGAADGGTRNASAPDLGFRCCL